MLLTMEEAHEALRLDTDDNDHIIDALLESIPSYLEVSTGYNWASDVDIHPMAKTTAKFILQLWFDPQHQDSVRMKRTIDSLLVGLTAIGRARSGT